jgi:hypothetical protein
MSIIKTASWWTPLPDDHVRIGISRGTPRFRVAAGYRLYKRLNPGPWFSSADTATFTERYHAEVLHRLDPEQVLRELVALAPGRVPVLVCWERVGGVQWCHRSLAANWLAAGLGIVVPEFGFEDLPQDRHPLLPPALLI